MLRLSVVTSENYNEETKEFMPGVSVELVLEHSLVSVSKWEEIWEVPFLDNEEKTKTQVLSYIMCMDLQGNLTQEIFPHMKEKHLAEITKYIEANKTATTIAERPGPPNLEVTTSEVIYYWMIAHGIPVEFENWHLNRLLMLIRVCNVKNGPKEKIPAAELAARNRALNEQRRRELGTTG